MVSLGLNELITKQAVKTMIFIFVIHYLTSIGNPIVKMLLWLFYLHNEIFYSDKMASSYWNGPQTPHVAPITLTS